MLLLPLAQAATTATLLTHGGLGRVEIQPEPGQHVNQEAPARLSNGRDEVTGSGDLGWARLPVAQDDRVTLDVGVCDDDGSNCRQLSLVGTVTNAARGRTALVEPEPIDPATRPAGYAVRLYDFTAIWCPPCQRLAAEVLHDPADAERLSLYEIVQVDADQPASWELKSRYQVTGYPTVLAVDAQGNEVDRYLGFESEPDFWLWLSGLDGRTPLSRLEPGPPANVAGDEAATVALRFFKANKPELATPWLAAASGNTRAYHEARLHAEAVDARADAEWMVANAAADDWLYLVVERYPELWPRVVRLVVTLDPGTAAACLDAYASSMDGDQADAALAARAGALALLRSTLTTDPAHDKGRIVEIADLHAATGDLAGALGQLDEYKGLFPAEFTWDFTAARLLSEGTRLPEAEARGRAALALAQGDQVLRAAERLATILDAQGKRAEALALVRDTLAGAARPGPTVDVRTHRYIKALEALQAKLGG